MAHSGHSVTEFRCPALGVKRTSESGYAMSAFDPKRTSAEGRGRSGSNITDMHFASLGRAFQRDDRGSSPIEGGPEGGRSVSWKRCDQVIDKGSRRWLGGSAARIDGVELDRSRVPFR